MNNILRLLSRINRVVWVVIILLIILRIFLPVGIKYTINWYLENKIEAYQGRIADFDLTLYRGAYQIQDLKIWKRGQNPEPPFVEVGQIDLSLAWRALFKGELLGDLSIDAFKFSFVDSTSDKKKQYGSEEKNWNEVLSALVPIKIESLRVANSEVRFLNKDYKVPVDILVDRIFIDATNLRNTDNKNILLPSTATVKGRLQKDADFLVKGRINALRSPPAFSMDAQLNTFKLASMNNFFLVYGPFSFARGTLSLFSEVATHDGKIKGYVKPFLEDIKMNAPSERFISFKHRFAEFLLGASNLLLRNNVKDAATKVEFEGDLTSPNVDAWGAFWSSLRNAFVEPLDAKIENSIDIKSVPKKN